MKNISKTGRLKLGFDQCELMIDFESKIVAIYDNESGEGLEIPNTMSEFLRYAAKIMDEFLPVIEGD